MLTGTETLESSTLFLCSKGHVSMHSRAYDIFIVRKPKKCDRNDEIYQTDDIQLFCVVIKNVCHETEATQTH